MAAHPDSILPGLAAILARAAKVDPARITRDTRPREDFGLDSLAMIDLIVAAEDEFGVRIPDEDAERFQTVGDLADFIGRGVAG